ncbi:molybdopterin molybdotransferase MoeA [Sphingobium sp. CR28]|uniref:molybdopterin molybdotransferase MoeA n=1 Tax=Sphingobium sp. CR28 TaxID=3400272 RepID=UPI003FEE7886
MSLLPVKEAQRRLIALAPPAASEELPLHACAGRILAETVRARRDQPSADLSAMDGYAVRAADGDGPWRLTGESAAGAAPSARPLPPGAAMRIFTGAPLPPGADCIILQETVAVEADMVRLTEPCEIRPGHHVRTKANDFALGETLFEAGRRLDARAIALAALAGHDRLSVYRKPRVAILSTGNELARPGETLRQGQIPASNGLMLRAMIEQAGGEVISELILPDDLPVITQALRAVGQKSGGADIIVTCGGASVGDHDLVRPAIEAAGGAIDFWKIRMRPGKPLIAGTVRDALLLGLPGNPVSAFVTGLLFLLPLVRHMSGDAAPFPALLSRRLAVPLPAGGERDDYMRAVCVGADGVKPLRPQDSAQLSALFRADCLLLRPAGSLAANAGELVQVLPLA